jgi:hypothetical protein
METARDYLRRATRTVKKARRHLRWLGAVAWFLTGMALWIGGTLLWRAWPLRPEPVPRQAAAAPVVVTPVTMTPEPAAPALALPEETATSAAPATPPVPPKKAHRPYRYAKPRRYRRWR